MNWKIKNLIILYDDVKNREPKAQIGYTYQDSTKTSFSLPNVAKTKLAESDLSDENEEDLDFNLSIDKLTNENKIILDKCALNYGMENGDYVKCLLMEEEEKEKIKQNKLLEEEKAQYSVSITNYFLNFTF